MNNVSKIFFPALVLWFLLPTNSFSQADTSSSGFKGFKADKFPTKQNIIKFSPIPCFVGQIPFCGEIRLTYERMLAYNQSLTLGLSYNYPSLFLFVMPAITNPSKATLKNYSLRGGRITLGYRYYPLKRKSAPDGLFFGPYGSFNFVKIKERKGNGSYDLVYYADACLITGYQVALRKGVYMEFIGGLGYRMNKVYEYDARNNQGATHDYYIINSGTLKNLKVLLQMNICYGF
jgi:hypothetical protein